MNVIETDGLSRWYGEVIGLNDVTVSVGPGITGLLGPNGAGKSSFMRMVSGELRPSLGTARVFGEAPFANPRVHRRIGYSPEGRQLGGQVIDSRGVYRGAIERVDDLMERLEAFLELVQSRS